MSEPDRVCLSRHSFRRDSALASWTFSAADAIEPVPGLHTMLWSNSASRADRPAERGQVFAAYAAHRIGGACRTHHGEIVELHV